MIIIRHIPHYCEGLTPSGIKFDNLNELLNIPFVSDYRMYKNFKRYSLSPRGYNDNDQDYLLMAEFNSTDDWKVKHWVIGYITKNTEEILDLPIWEYKDESYG